MRTLENGRVPVERRRRAVEEVRELLARVYRGFVAWGSLYGDGAAEEELERRERVVALLGEMTNAYAPRSLWLEESTRRKVESFIGKSDDLRSRFCAEVEERGYERARPGISRRVSKELRSLKREVELSLEDELAGPRPARWQGRWRGLLGG